MIAAATIVAGLFLFLLITVTTLVLSFSASRRHLTFRQILSTFVVALSATSSIAMMYQSLVDAGIIAAWPMLLAGFTFLFSIGQFGLALVMGTLTRLRQLAAR